MRSGEVEWLDELAFPGALRTLHTQIMQCSPGDPGSTAARRPTGYGAYRTDFNSSHAYFENLFLYYWLTGDSTVVDALRRGGDEHAAADVRQPRAASRSTEARGPDGPACAASEPPTSVGFTGRVALAVDRRLPLPRTGERRRELPRGLSLRARPARSPCRYAELERGGRRYGFLGAQGALRTRDLRGRPVVDERLLRCREPLPLPARHRRRADRRAGPAAQPGAGRPGAHHGGDQAPASSEAARRPASGRATSSTPGPARASAAPSPRSSRKSELYDTEKAGRSPCSCGPDGRPGTPC